MAPRELIKKDLAGSANGDYHVSNYRTGGPICFGGKVAPLGVGGVKGNPTHLLIVGIKKLEADRRLGQFAVLAAVAGQKKRGGNGIRFDRVKCGAESSGRVAGSGKSGAGLLFKAGLTG